MSGAFSAPLMTNDSISNSVRATVKASKFKPSIVKKEDARHPGLQSFSTPGFQSTSSSGARKAREVVYVSSDSTPPTPSLKRDSSDFSIFGETHFHVSKRQKKDVEENKENFILQTSSKSNMVTTERPSVRPHTDFGSEIKKRPDFDSDLASLSPERLQQLKLFALSERVRIGDECLYYHNGDTSKDIALLGALKDLVCERITAIEKRMKDPQGQNESNVGYTLEITRPLTSKHMPLPDITSRREDTAIVEDSLTHSRFNTTKLIGEGASDDEYWGAMDDITVDGPVVASSSTVMPSSDLNKSSSSSLDTIDGSSPFSSEISQKMKTVFKLASFRRNQLGAITATLEGRDVFVLMPTGGGKSLCYQLPAICTAGKTQGVTVVISPLRALMKDQVDSLRNKHIDALLSNAETNGAEDWHQLVVSNRKPSLWYITPEKLRDSQKVRQILERLYQENKIARFVVDEAHCISTWGQDFRDAYAELGSLRERYKSVPIMALTATANKRTQADIVAQLGLRPDHAVFSQSFNRTNLRYMVRRKKGYVTNEIATILEKYSQQSGIIYCHSRSSCEKLAQRLREKGFVASHFHAGLPEKEKGQTVRDWQMGKSIIVATIAFGMGIDKADVRYVIHHDMPKTLSGYYQETGRAGRDGKPAECIMFFSLSDMKSLINQIRDTEGVTAESKARQEAAVREVYQFCDNTSECRRVQILQHFDERFDKKDCTKSCDICMENRETVSTDVTMPANTVLRLIQTINQQRREKVTKNQLIAIVRGNNTVDVRAKNHETLPGYGACKDMDRDLLELMFNRLEFMEVLASVSEKNRANFHNTYAVLGPQARTFLQRREPFFVDWHRKPDRGNKQRKKTAGPGESISAPVRSKKGKQKATEDDPIQVFDDLYDMGDDADAFYVDSISSRIHAPHTPSTPSMTTQSSVPSDPASSAVSAVQFEDTSESAEVLYKKMLALRAEVKQKQGLEADADVFDDSVLQYLSLLCPTDYQSFKRELTNSLDEDVPDLEELVNIKWDQYGQMFLQLCIGHKAGTSSSKPTSNVFTTEALHSRFDYQPLTTRTPSAGPHPKFKPS